MENRTNIGEVKWYLDLKEKIKAQEYFEVWIYYHPLFLIYGHGDIRYEVTAKDMNEAIEKAQKLHLERFSFSNEDVEKESEPSYIRRYKVIRLSDKKILDTIWDGSLGSHIYMRHWEPGMETKDLIKLLETNEPGWFSYKAHYVEKIWELDLMEARPCQAD